MQASWKTSSASFGPTAATTKRYTSLRCASSTAWKGGSFTGVKRSRPATREISVVAAAVPPRTLAPLARLAARYEERRSQRDASDQPARLAGGHPHAAEADRVADARDVGRGVHREAVAARPVLRQALLVAAQGEHAATVRRAPVRHPQLVRDAEAAERRGVALAPHRDSHGPDPLAVPLDQQAAAVEV